jgi:hypothetical protein
MKQHPPARTWGLLAAATLASIVVAPACTRARAASRAEEPTPVGAATIAIGLVADEPPPPVAKEARRAERTDCPNGMVLVEGEYCPDVEENCLEWMDPPESRYHHFRCAHYAPSVCKSKDRVHMRFCIDRTERAEAPARSEDADSGADGSLPRHFMSWTSSKKLCEAEGGRLCRESEWQFACEGEEMRPYPYGWDRDSSACNVDIAENIGRPGRLVDHRAAVGSHEKCASPFGVQDLAGNLEEWVQADGTGKMGWKEVLKGSWWIPSRHACRQFQVGHNAVYNGAETGTRCCKDPASQP